METVFDWVTVALFAGIAILFLQRSAQEGEPRDKMIEYIPPAAGCAFANYVGNKGLPLLAVIIILAVIAYIFHILKPFKRL
jgi:hypothetical protein